MLADNRAKFLLIIVVLISLFLGINNAFVQDDAFISFRYAENLVEHVELNWNIGEERVEGYSNFLWTLLIAFFMWIGSDPVITSMVLGLIFGLGTLIITYYSAKLMTGSNMIALIALIILGTNYTFSSYMTGGLETQFVTFQIMLLVFLTLLSTNESGKSKRIINAGISLLFATLILTRLDSGLFCLIAFVYLTVNIIKNKGEHNVPLAMTLLILPAVFIISGWLYWKYQYYGDILPNTYYVKAAGNNLATAIRGLKFTYFFVDAYFLYPFVFLGLVFIKKLSEKSFYVFLITMSILWVAYVIKIGGGFMEFRFFVPILPLISIIIAILLSYINQNKVKAVFVLSMIVVSYFHASTFHGVFNIEPIYGLRDHVTAIDEDWESVGKELSKFREANATIAVTPAGAIPYYSKLRSIDMLGLNDKYIAKHGEFLRSMPGHQKIASMKYIIESDVNLLIVHPNMIPLNSSIELPFELFQGGYYTSDDLPEGTKLIEIPINLHYKIIIPYIKPTAAIDSVIDEQGYKIIELDQI